MELSQEFLIDMALNVGGYLFAGIFSVVVYSMFRRKPKAAACAGAASTPPVQDEAAVELTATEETRKIEFVKLGSRTVQPAARPTGPGAAALDSPSDRRNRSETIRIARTMLKAGASQERIKRLLPISDAELSLLTMSKS